VGEAVKGWIRKTEDLLLGFLYWCGLIYLTLICFGVAFLLLWGLTDLIRWIRS